MLMSMPNTEAIICHRLNPPTVIFSSHASLGSKGSKIFVSSSIPFTQLFSTSLYMYVVDRKLWRPFVGTRNVLLLCLANLDCSLGKYIATLNMLSLNWVPKHISDILRHTLYEKVNGKWQTCKTTNKANESRFRIYPTRLC